MFEVKVTIESPALVEAMNNLASAIVSGMTVKIPEVKVDTQPVQNQQTAPAAPTQEVPQTPVQTQPIMNVPTAAPAPTSPTQAPVQQTPVAPTQPAQQAAKTPITLEAISRAGAALVDQGKMQQIMGLLSKYGVQAITQLQPNTYEAFAAEMRTLGAQI